MGILDEDIARVRAETDMVAVVSEHVALKKSGRRYQGLCPFHAEKTASFSVNAEEGLYYCLAGETRVLTWEGVRPISELAGTTQRILTEKGSWVDAPFRSFGVQPLMKITLNRNRQKKVLYATPEHRWLVRGRGTHRFERTTDALRVGHPLAYSFPPNRTRFLGDLSPFGIAHGIAFGDGSRYANAACVDLYGEKDAQLLKWFPHSRTYTCHTSEGKPYIRVLDLPKFFKDRPSLDEAPTYLAGWLAGYLAADGCVAADGTVMLNSADRETLEFVRQVCTRLGIATYGITMQMREGFEGREPSALYRVHFVNDDLDERFFLLETHRARFGASAKAFARRGWVVESVESTDRVEEVFCAEVDGTHNFTLEDNILTGNCFGCQAKGDVITFVREVEHLDFAEAVERLAAKAGIQLHYDSAATGRDRKRRDLLFDAMTRAVDWYHQRLLSSPDAAAARGYLRSRGYDGDIVRQFQIGWAPDEWDALARHLSVPDDVLQDTGLGFVNRRSRQQDGFRSRVMFPIFDTGSKPVAFGGRILPGAPSEQPKYKNSPETPIYSKRRTLYGLNWAKADVVSASEVIVCEGYTDVIAFFVAGMPRAVATCGTAVGDEHLRMLKNFAGRAVLAYDADAAGQAAAERFYEWEQKLGIDIAVAAFPAGSDPADMARRDPEALKAAVEHAQPFLAFRVERSLAGADLRTPEARARAAEAALSLVAEHPNDLVRNEYIGRIAAVTDLPAERLARSIKRVGANPVVRPVERMNRAAEGPELNALRLAISQPETVAERLVEEMFTEELHAAAFRALANAATLHEAIEHADPGAAALLQRLAVEDTDADPDDVVARLLDQAIGRATAELDRQTRESQDVETSHTLMSWLKLTREQLYDPATRVDAAERLVAWLAERGEED